MGDLAGWAMRHSVQINPKLDLFDESNGVDRGVVARAAIAKGEVLVRVPQALALSPILAARGPKRQKSKTAPAQRERE